MTLDRDELDGYLARIRVAVAALEDARNEDDVQILNVQRVLSDLADELAQEWEERRPDRRKEVSA